MDSKHESKKFNVVLFEWRYSESLYKYTLGLHYLTSVLRKADYNVKDLIFENDSVEDVANYVLSLNPDMIGIHFYRETEGLIFAFSRRIKSANPNIKIVLGGHTATLYGAQILNSEAAIDIISCGEGELTTLELCSRLKNGESLEGCKGIFYRKDGVVYRNEDRELIENLDELPYPALDVLLEKHSDSKCIFTAISTSRGCMGKCGFCITNRVYGNKVEKGWRGRSPENVVGELKYLQETFKGKRLVYRIVDGSFEDPDPITKSRLKRIIELFEENDIRIPFGILTRAESWSIEDEDLIQRMKRVGLYEVAIGFEASTQHSLKVLNKRADLEDNYRAYNLFTRNNINVFGFLIMFHPYTSFEELKINAKFLLDMDMAYHPQNWWSELYMWPDSRIFPDVVRDGLLLGTEPRGYQIQYAFQDGRVAKVHRVLQEISDIDGIHLYRESIEKIKLECMLYDTWKEQYSEMDIIKEDMQEYQMIYKKAREEMGIRQYEIFMELLKAVESDTISSLKNTLVNEWSELTLNCYKNLEKDWIRFRMKFGRKKVTLI